MAGARSGSPLCTQQSAGVSRGPGVRLLVLMQLGQRKKEETSKLEWSKAHYLQRT